ncbi:hypothetical protein CK203_034374 [Vitis vinifera]|uniref:DUF659 domain-containing protein n=1 Tax=Vitis vinifera TaxID=29760 RepID=A0A438HZ89_VITVI|nr:hypothetical protein CK203_034374 [Vitis vinifera]
MNMGSEDVNEDLFGLEDEDFCEEINSRMNVTNISSGEMVVQNRRSRKMYQTTTNDAYKKEARERACMFITRWMYEAVIPFNAVTYPSFQPMIEAIGQYGVGMKGPTFHEVRVTNLKKELVLTKDLMKDHMVEWGKNRCLIMLDGWTDRKERTLVNFFVNYSKGTMFMQSIDASSMIKTGEKMFELLDKWVEQVGEENVIKVITDNHSSYVSSPLVRVLRLVDGEKKTLMRYIYEDLNRAKDTIVRSFNRNEEKYKEIFNIIDKRWEIQLHRPLHAAGNSQGLFRNELVVRRMKTRAPGCERNWSIFEDIHSKRRNRAIGAEEAKFDTRARARARSSIIPLMRGIASSSRTLPFHSLIDEDEDRDMVDSTDEEYGEGYKCGDGNDDDGDFVDLEEE